MKAKASCTFFSFLISHYIPINFYFFSIPPPDFVPLLVCLLACFTVYLSLVRVWMDDGLSPAFPPTHSINHLFTVCEMANQP